LKKIIYLIAITVYIGVSVLGAYGNDYIETGGSASIVKENPVFVILTALIVGISVFWFFPRVFPKGYSGQNRAGRILLPVTFFILSFAFTIGVLLFINTTIGPQERVRINGVIEKKWVRGESRSKDYLLGLRDSASGRYYEFKVKKTVYEQIGNVNEKVAKDFYRGSLGVMYRYSY
jgi:hypothetical protein